ncbi:hypothetical protein GCM10008018_20450 [Paenibacillus marchantiophytorum]|uniref:Uncharacterized protein n=1 Tax=Paenibacillus marchantiophytorum TaxID=1619310 RepID=A0ABQ2BT59_9BACL|nr:MULTISPECIES: hypothetical protein [Paenibacillus]UKS25416.1 hypothetical protein LOZ80_28040 [Paenibacillus sp. HWE-109]GGI47096.1 hypothetical protein GCM10008018_20450 [Paenibacillus marchantiophytorum]
MQIKKKNDIGLILDNFSSFAKWDASGKKLYLVFADNKRGGQWTLMNYGDDRFSVHGLGEDYQDDRESFFEERNSVVTFLWNHRAALKAAVQPTT